MPVDAGRIRRLEEQVRARLASVPLGHLPYHGPHHTLSDVLPAVRRISRDEGVGEREAEWLEAAALLHDMGFLEVYGENERIGARMAAEVLPAHGFAFDEIDRIADLILATALYEVQGVWLQDPGDDLLKRILCDADLDNLGREDFPEVSDSLRRELAGQGKVLSDAQWCRHQLAFLTGHRWFTASQAAAREEGKRRNLERLRQELSNLS